MPVLFAVAAALCFGSALVTSRIGLRSIDPRAGAAISVPTAMLLFVGAAPFALDLEGFNWPAFGLFVAVGLFFPAAVTLLTFRSTEVLGATVTSAVSGAAPIFAIGFAWLLLGEQVPPEAAMATLGVLAGVVLISWRRGAMTAQFPLRQLGWPVAGAVVRGLAQALAKAGLALWPNPFAAGLVGYLLSAAVVTGAARLGGVRTRPTRRSRAWFALTGMLNGSAVLLMYAALARAPVSTVAPIIAAYPLFTALLGAAVLREEKLTGRVLAGTVVTVAAVVWLVASRD
ncbi:MAG TPA: DMT family transporter [Burkholderiales bacterium]